MDNRLNRLYTKSITILKKEIKNIQLLSIGGKLEPGPARDLTNYIKLLRELKQMEANIQQEKTERSRTKLSDADLEAAVLNAKKTKDR